MRLLKGSSSLYTRFTFLGVRVHVIGAILVCLSITKVILNRLRLLRSVVVQFRDGNRGVPLQGVGLSYFCYLDWSERNCTRVLLLHILNVS